MIKIYKYIAIDPRYNFYLPILKHPRKELINHFNTTYIQKMYTDLKTGEILHIGYIIKNHWIHIFKITPFKLNKGD